MCLSEHRLLFLFFLLIFSKLYLRTFVYPTAQDQRYLYNICNKFILQKIRVLEVICFGICSIQNFKLCLTTDRGTTKGLGEYMLQLIKQTYAQS